VHKSHWDQEDHAEGSLSLFAFARLLLWTAPVGLLQLARANISGLIAETTHPILNQKSK
jgi:hypothetical protein